MELKQHNNSVQSITLNKHIAQAGICSRRKAALLVQEGLVRVNGIVVKDPGFRVTSQDVIAYQKRALIAEKKGVYILLNKPRRILTSCSDDQGRMTVMDLLPAALQSSGLFPIGRLDKETTGLLLLTNDGALAQHMSHPRYQVSKVYQAILDRPLPEEIMARIARGIKLDDGFVKVDQIEYSCEHDQSYVRIGLHSGKNQIIKRIFKHVGFWVKKLERVSYAGLSTKGLAKSEWRHLTKYEITQLQRIIKKT
jgi:23S rRNA pseudouridine2605 synthase